jgi:hypothetical protein
MHSQLKVLYSTKGILRKISAQDREMSPRLKGYMRASEGVERAREKRPWHTANKSAIHVYQKPSSEASKTFAQRTPLICGIVIEYQTLQSLKSGLATNSLPAFMVIARSSTLPLRRSSSLVLWLVSTLARCCMGRPAEWPKFLSASPLDPLPPCPPGCPK